MSDQFMHERHCAKWGTGGPTASCTCGVSNSGPLPSIDGPLYGADRRDTRIAALEEMLKEHIGPLTGDDLWCEKPDWSELSPGRWKYKVCGECWTCRARALVNQEMAT